MALSKEEKEALAAHYHGKDLYDPSKAPEQEVTSFAPKMNCGGEMGYAEGGDVFTPADLSKQPNLVQGGIEQLIQGPMDNENFSGPSLSGDTDTIKGNGLFSRPEPLRDGLISTQTPASRPILPQEASLATKAASGLNPADLAGAKAMMSQRLTDSVNPETPAPAPAPQATEKLNPDQYDELVKTLSKGPSLGQSAMSGLAGLADAISSGVARAPSPGFQKNIMEGQQNQKRNLIDSLRQKYEAGYRGKELEQSQGRLTEEGRHNIENEKETRRARELTQSGQNLEAKRYAEQHGLEKQKMSQEEQHKQDELDTKTVEENKYAIPGTDRAALRNDAEARLQARTKTMADSAGPYGPTVKRNGKVYEWSPVSKQYHPAK